MEKKIILLIPESFTIPCFRYININMINDEIIIKTIIATAIKAFLTLL